MDIDSLKPFFQPERVALLGATQKFGFGYGQTKTLINQGLGDRLFLVNPSQQAVFGTKCYPSVRELPVEVDLAVLIVPAKVIPSALKDCAGRGVKAAIVQSAGFAETGPEGKKLQDEMVAVAKEHGIRIIGPNCMGVVNTANGFTTTETVEEALRPGSIGTIAQSGVFASILMDVAPERGVRFSKVITMGNRSDVDETDLITYLLNDEQTKVIALYLEGVRDGERFLRTVRSATRRKPVVVLKGGRTPAGRAATLSHTGSLSGEDEIYSGAFAQSGIMRVRELEELLDLSKALAVQPVPRGRRVAIVTTSGSVGAMTVDMCTDLGLIPAELSSDTVRSVRSTAPAWMNVRNPLDVGPSPLFFKGVEAVMRDPNVDGVIAVLLIPWMVVEAIRALGIEIGHSLADLSGIRGLLKQKPLLFSMIGTRELKELVQDVLGEDIPILSSPENAARVFSHMARYGDMLAGSPA
jgi:acetyltransferase